MRKMDRIIRESHKGNLSYLQYLEFFKSIDSSIIKGLSLSISSSHKMPGHEKKLMYNAPFKSYQKYKCNKMLVVVTGRSRLPQYTEMAITSDEKGEDIIQYVQMDESKHEDQKITLYRNDFYMHYPIKRPTLFGFGNQDRARLGTGKTSQDILYTSIFQMSKKVVKEITARRHFTCILDTYNQIYIAGNVRGCNERKEFTHCPLPNEAQIETYSVGRHSVLVLGSDQKFYWWGKSKYKHFQEADGHQDKFTQMANECAPRVL